MTLLGGGFGRKSKPDYIVEAAKLAQATDVTVAADIERFVDATVAQFGGVYDDPEVGLYVAQVGARLLAAAGQQGKEYTFTVLDSDLPNAFAAGHSRKSATART